MPRCAWSSDIVREFGYQFLQIIPLLQEAEAVNAEVRKHNADIVGIDGLPHLGVLIPWILQDLKLPALKQDEPPAWPLPGIENQFAVALASSIAPPRDDQL